MSRECHNSLSHTTDHFSLRCTSGNRSVLRIINFNYAACGRTSNIDTSGVVLRPLMLGSARLMLGWAIYWTRRIVIGDLVSLV